MCFQAARGVLDVPDTTGAARRSSEPHRAVTCACGLANVRCHKRCVSAAVRGRCTPSTCRVSDIAIGANITNYSTESDRAVTHARGVADVRCHRRCVSAAVCGGRALSACGVSGAHVTGGARRVRDVAKTASLTSCSNEPRRAGTVTSRLRGVGSNRIGVPTALCCRRAQRACRVSDVAGGTGVACRSSEPRRAGTRACGLGSIRRH